MHWHYYSEKLVEYSIISRWIWKKKFSFSSVDLPKSDTNLARVLMLLEINQVLFYWDKCCHLAKRRKTIRHLAKSVSETCAEWAAAQRYLKIVHGIHFSMARDLTRVFFCKATQPGFLSNNRSWKEERERFVWLEKSSNANLFKGKKKSNWKSGLFLKMLKSRNELVLSFFSSCIRFGLELVGPGSAQH